MSRTNLGQLSNSIRGRIELLQARLEKLPADEKATLASIIAELNHDLSNLLEAEQAEEGLFAIAEAQQQILELIARGVALADVLEALTKFIQEQSKVTICSILLQGSDGLQLQYGIAPDMAEAYGLRSCWSKPIFSPSGSVLGIFAMYYRESDYADPKDLELLEVASYLAGIVIERNKAELLFIHQKQVLELIAGGAPLLDVLNRLTIFIEQYSVETLCSIMLLNEDDNTLKSGVAPNLPSEYLNALNGMPIGPNEGSCGTAMFKKETVIVSDIEHDPLWLNYKDLALQHNLRACWSKPIMATNGDVFGSFAMYYREPRNPLAADLQLLEVSTHLASIAFERNRFAEALQISEARYRTVSELTSDYVWSFHYGADGLSKTEWATGAIESITGYSVVELNAIGDWRNIVHPDYIQQDIEFHEQLVLGRNVVDEQPIIRKDGTICWLRVYAQPLWDDKHEKIIGAIGATQDITKQKLTEEALRLSESRYRTVSELTSAYVGSLSFDANNKPVTDWVTGGFESITGYTLAELNAMGDWKAIVHPDYLDNNGTALSKLLSGQPTVKEQPIIRKDGETRWLRVYSRPLWDENHEKIIGAIGATQDITEQRLAEEALRLSEERHRVVSEMTSDYIWELKFTEHGQRSDWTIGALENITGYTSEELNAIGDWAKVIHPDYREENNRYRQLILQGHSIVKEQPIIRKDGMVRWLQIYMRPTWDETHTKITGVIGATRDISKEKLAEEALKESEKRYRQISEMTSDYVWTRKVDEQGNPLNIEWTAGSIETLTGYTDEEIKVLDWWQLYHVEEREIVGNNIRMYAQGKPSAQANERRIITKSGEVRWIYIYTRPEWDEAGQRVIAVCAAAKDITKQKLAEEALKESEKRYRLISEMTSDCVWSRKITSPAVIEPLEWLIGAIQSLTGYTEAEFRDLNWEKLYYPEDMPEIRQDYEQILKGHTIVAERRIITKNGELRWVRIYTRPDWDGNLQKIVRTVTAAQDITEERQAEEQKHALERRLLEAQKLESLGVLAGGIAHDFNNLLVGIMGNAGLALMDIEENSPLRETIEQIELAAQHAAELTRQMLAYSGKGRFVIQTLNLNNLIEEMTSLLRASLNKNAVLMYKLDPLAPAITGDVAQIRQVLMNLIVNAADAIGDKSGFINVSTEVIWADKFYLAQTYLAADLPEGHYVCLEISDNGVGMDAETQAKIFEPFFSTKSTGRGLGLSAVMGIVRSHKGTLKVSSTPGEGTTFSVLLPCTTEALPLAVLPHKTLPEATPNGTLLIIDDENGVRDVIKRSLTRVGYRVLTANGGEEGLQIFRQHCNEIDCVVLDMIMPDMNGQQVFNELTAIQPAVNVILMSGYSEQETVLKFGTSALRGFLQKPFAPLELQRKIKEVVSGQWSVVSGQ